MKQLVPREGSSQHSRGRVAWLRYQDPVTPEQVAFAVGHYAVAVLQPWEVRVAEQLKAARPDMVVLGYKCLSSSRSNELGPVFSSGVSHAEAEDERWFAHRRDGSRVAWERYEHHWQMAVWDPGYQKRWVENVVAWAQDSPWDGVMADNDVYGDYYGLRPPLEGGRTMQHVRGALGELVAAAGPALSAAGKLLVPNIAEARREPGRWAAHSAWGGGMEEVWLAWGPEATDRLEPVGAWLQGEDAAGPGLVVLHTVTDGTPGHPHTVYGLAASWVFGGGRAAYSATGHDQYSGTPWHAQMEWDLGDPVGGVDRTGHAGTRTFTHGWAAVNLGAQRDGPVQLHPPRGLRDAQGSSVDGPLVLGPQQGVLLRRP